MTGTKTILGFIAGLSIGAIAGILLSPEKGADTRQKIIDRASDLGASLKDCVTDFIKGKKAAAQTEDSIVPKMNLNTMG